MRIKRLRRGRIKRLRRGRIKRLRRGRIKRLRRGRIKRLRAARTRLRQGILESHLAARAMRLVHDTPDVDSFNVR
ncbi:hypothetical protein [Microbacterium lacticum]